MGGKAMRSAIEYILFALLFFAASITFIWFLLSIFTAILGGAG
jgi:hypothetical protein